VKITLELTPAEAKVLREHWTGNLNYGASGTFGDGENLNAREYAIGKRILGKIAIAIDGKAVQS